MRHQPTNIPDHHRAASLRTALAQGAGYRFPESLGGLWGQVLKDQVWPVAPGHRYLEQVGGWVPEDVWRRSRIDHLLERDEPLAVG